MSTSASIHPSAIVGTTALIGEGSRVWHFCHIMDGAVIGRRCVLGHSVFVAGGARIGDGCRIQNHVSVYDGVILEDDVFVGPSAVFTNVKRPRAAFPRRDRYAITRVGRGATIGANATIVCGVRIGEGAMVGAGAVVTRDVGSFVLVLGAPARAVGGVCRCGESLDASATCAECGRRYRSALAGFEESSP